MQGDAGQVQTQAHAGAFGRETLLVHAVAVVAAVLEAVDQLIRALFKDIGTEQGGAAIHVARVHIEQGAEVTGRLDQYLQAQRVVVVTLEILGAVAGTVVMYAVAAVLRLRRHARGDGVADRQVDRAFEVLAAVVADTDRGVAVGLADLRLGRVELDHAGRGITAEQRALWAAQHFDLVDVKDREAFEHRAFLHDVVDHQADRLRCVQIEVGIALAADVKARE